MPGDRVLRAFALILLSASGASAQNPVQGVARWQEGTAAGAVVWLLPAGGTTGSPAAADTVLIDQSHLRFDPDVLVIPPGTVVRFLNSDETMHNVFSPQRRGAGFDLGTYPRTESRSFVFREPGRYVVLCHVHPEMVSWVVVVPTPYFALADEAGRFRIDAVPPGSYRLEAWHRRAGGVAREIDIAGSPLSGIELRFGGHAASDRPRK